MGLVQDVHAAVGRYRAEALEAAQAARDLAETVAGLAERISPRGPLGESADPDLVAAATLLATARARLLAAAAAAATARVPAQEYAERAFPL